MIKKTVLSILALATLAGSVLATVDDAQAQYRRHQPGYNDSWGNPPPRDDGNWGNPPPPPQRRHHNRDIAAGIAAGLIGGIIGGAIANQNQNYAPPPPPPPRCWFEDREVENQYDGGSHIEQVRVCR